MWLSFLLILSTVSSLPMKFSLPQDSLLDEEFFKGGVEEQIVGIFNTIFNTTENIKNGIVLDIGMNSGYYSLLTASWNVKVLSIEPQPKCHEIIQRSLETNNSALAQFITTINVAAGKTGSSIKVGVNVCDPGFVSSKIAVSSSNNVERNVITLSASSLLSKTVPVKIVKIDTEGAELNILVDLIQYIRNGGSIMNLIVEVAPHVWHVHHKSKEDGVHILSTLQSLAKETILLFDEKRFGFDKTIHVLPDGIKGEAFKDFSMAMLIDDRLRKRAGCNLLFTFNN